MADFSLEQIEQLLDKKLSDFRDHVDEGFAKTATIDQIDAVAKHLAETNAHLGEINASLKHQSESLEAISRRLNADLDRLDDHGTRIERLEAKTAHLPAPPASR